MDMNFKRLIGDATRLTRSGDLEAATRAIQRALGGGAPDDGDATRAERETTRPGGDGARVIDGEWTRVDAGADSGGGAPRTGARSDAQPDVRPGARSEPGTPDHPDTRNGNASSAPGRVVRARHTDAKGTLDYRLFVPARAAGAPPPPLLVMLHGCTQNADDFAIGTRMDELARQHGCLVLYPDQSDRANPQRCWNWFKHTHQRRGGGEAGLIERCVRDIVAEHGADPARVFVAGLSAGGAMAAILGSVCPDLFAGVGVHSGLAAGAASNLPEALMAMQRGAPAGAASTGTLPPTIVFHGDADRTVHPDNGERIVEACTAAAGAGSIAPTVRRQAGEGGARGGARSGARGWTQSVHRAANGRMLAEHWSVQGVAHAWSGGDRRGSYTDAAGPDASREMMRFFLAL